MSENESKKNNTAPPTPKSVKNEEKIPTIPEDIRLNKIQWTDGIDKLLSTWADNALCYKWLHEKATYKYSKINFGFSIPIIILSTISGTLSVGLSGYVPTAYQLYGQAGIGALNIFAGILTTLQNFFRPSNLSEAHRITALGWSKLYRNISNELRMQPNFRKEPNLFYKQARTEFDRLLETQPVIPTDIIKKFKNKFKSTNLDLPDVLDTLAHTEPYKEEFENIVSDYVDSARDSKLRVSSILDGIQEEPTSQEDLEKAIQKIEQTGGTLEHVWTNEGKRWRIRNSITNANVPKRFPPPLKNESISVNTSPPISNENANIKSELEELLKKSVVKNLSNKFKGEENPSVEKFIEVEKKTEETSEINISPEFHIVDIRESESKENTEN